MMDIVIRHKREIPSAVKKLLKYYGDKRIFAFDGPMGSGKTTIIKELCRELGASDITSSPTFTIVNEYRRQSGSSLFHIDLYRIRKPEEAFDIGIEEYLTGSSWCFIEWPGIIAGLLPEETVRVTISVGENDERFLRIA
ncbi:MAG: tRNA (adenosine(37)-N6)-threonylcarbamoyltransferase complex ATPase subunit type 1 TsaE [Bacteroidales bacterium]|jgi:tRNA threonylcarbamoyladenosine biosynthesis protein TsaE|nr:tRNA (adenosine(37)-N6)-threonylcarbamoyltransferase complex ATPase subunit type 1 TsaE [Bacteroidales bacterium]